MLTNTLQPPFLFSFYANKKKIPLFSFHHSNHSAYTKQQELLRLSLPKKQENQKGHPLAGFHLFRSGPVPSMSTTTEIHHAPSPQSYASPPFTVILTITLLLFLFVGFFSIYFCRCFLPNLLYTWHTRNSPSGTPVGPSAGGAPGLDPSIIKSFPTFTCSSVKEYRREKYRLECAICLCEFKDEDILRILTTCYHVFHQDCIDLWLELHKSCPVCRRSLDAPAKAGDDVSTDPTHEIIREDGPLEDSISIAIKDDHEDKRGEHEEGQRATISGQIQRGNDSNVEKFSRSNTTGHSIVRSREEEEDKFTLRLPEHVTTKLIRGHSLTKSCTTFGQFKSQRTTFGEVSCGDVNNVQVL